jgi:hypothetical protein
MTRRGQQFLAHGQSKFSQSLWKGAILAVMTGTFYFVALAKSGESARSGSSEILVEILCSDHQNANEHARRSSAKEIAIQSIKDRDLSAVSDIGFTSAHRYDGPLPAHFLRTADFTALCDCRAWYWRGCQIGIEPLEEGPSGPTEADRNRGADKEPGRGQGTNRAG